MNFAEAVNEKWKWKVTENGQPALKTTGDALLDFYSSAGSMRNADVERLQRLFAHAFKEDPLLATKTVFWLRRICMTGRLFPMKR